jgi:hypothetical protein
VPLYLERGDQAHADDRCAADDVEHEVVSRHDNGERHGDRHRERESADGELPVRREQDDADEQVPAEVEAGERRVLVRQLGGLERPVRGRPFEHSVGQPDIE